MDKGVDRQLGVVLTGARIGCAIRIAVGAGLMAVGFGYEAFVTRVLLTRAIFVMALGLVPVGVGLYTVVRAGMRLHVLGRTARRPETLELVELAMRWGQPALRVTFVDGATESLSTGKADRNGLIDALRRRAIARGTPTARVVS